MKSWSSTLTVALVATVVVINAEPPVPLPPFRNTYIPPYQGLDQVYLVETPVAHPNYHTLVFNKPQDVYGPPPTTQPPPPPPPVYGLPEQPELLPPVYEPPQYQTPPPVVYGPPSTQPPPPPPVYGPPTTQPPPLYIPPPTTTTTQPPPIYIPPPTTTTTTTTTTPQPPRRGYGYDKPGPDVPKIEYGLPKY